LLLLPPPQPPATTHASTSTHRTIVFGNIKMGIARGSWVSRHESCDRRCRDQLAILKATSLVSLAAVFAFQVTRTFAILRNAYGQAAGAGAPSSWAPMSGFGPRRRFSKSTSGLSEFTSAASMPALAAASPKSVPANVG